MHLFKNNFCCDRRINPFDQASSQPVTDNSPAAQENAAFSQTFVVRFLGSMEVKRDRGENRAVKIS